MKLTHIGAVTAFVVISACKPAVGPAISLIRGPTILAVKGVPAEVDPRTANPLVHYEALLVDLGGRVPNADITSPLLWSICNQPKPPTESNSVSASCLDEDALPGSVGDSPTTYTALAPSDACTLFGPNPPPTVGDEPPIRARDADITGGYYLPVRLGLVVPDNLLRAGMATPNSLIGFQLERIYCGLKSAPGDIIRQYTATYNLNQNPVIGGLTMQYLGSEPVEVPALSVGSTPLPVPANSPLSLRVDWTRDSVENYPAYDVLARVLVYHNEAMRVSWYATAGSFEHDITGRSESESETFAENVWTPGNPGPVHLWIVLHDSRGGTDFAAYDIEVTP